MLALLIYSYANGLFPSRKIERTTYRDVAIRSCARGLIPTTTRSASFDAKSTFSLPSNQIGTIEFPINLAPDILGFQTLPLTHEIHSSL